MRLAPVLSLLLSLAALAEEPPGTVLLTGVPFVRQAPDFCGEAVVSMALGHLGRTVDQDQVFAATGTDPLKGRGAWTDELARGLRTLGIEPGPTWYRIDPRLAGPQIEAQWQAIVTDLRAGQPSVVCMHYDGSPGTTEHFRLVTGYDSQRDEVVYQEPAEDDGAHRRMKRADFLSWWTFKPAKDHWNIIRMRVTPAGAPPTIADEPRPTRAELSQHVQELKKTLPRGMTLAWEAPFLVVGDEAPDKVRQRAHDIVKWTKDLLLKDFFAESPRALHEVWILGSAPSYERTSRQLFGYEPDTPYGYYLSSRRALVMNIRPGYGTLTHELVHPYMHQAWAEAPAWLNEGLASLFEFPFEDHGHFKGRVNWRLPGLKEGLKRNVVPSFHTLTHLDQGAFYEDPAGLHYAEARYLCYFLQERGLLVPFVRRAIAEQAKDPSGWTALEATLGADPDSLRAEWEQFVKALGPRS